MVEDTDALKLGCCGCGCCALLITIIVLIATSLQTLNQGEYGIWFSHYAQTIEGPPMTSAGLKSVGPLNGLVRYPSVYQLVYFDDFAGYSPKQNEVVKPMVHSRTFDGLQVYVRVSFQWKLQPQHLEGIYRVLGGAEDLMSGARTKDKPSFVENIVRFARGSLTGVCSQYTASEFFENQTIVQAKMQESLQEEFNKPELGLMIDIKGLQLRSVDLPDEYETAIAETQKETQDRNTATAERETLTMKMRSDKLEAEKKNQRLNEEMKGTVQAIDEENMAWVTQYLNFQIKQADSYAELLQGLANNSAYGDPFDSLFELMRQKSLSQHDTDKVVLTM